MVLAISLLPQRDCATCTDLRKAQWGCAADALIPIKFDGEEARRCPKRPLLDQPEALAAVFTAYRWFTKGHLIESGSWIDQPAVYCDLMQIIDMAQADAEAEMTTRRGG
ncbi:MULTISPECIES: hypothetical protein [unclassified Azospirillum]|uniref:hypothetical protein n=1 Tax=unclassified Azospirillum TaxID=2630922 RepID=UPI000B6DF435|nr:MULTISPECIES: hypothetical protein [unclassified Azospirillum]SNS83854.1 hypothetical protein SAMN05880556_11329 [Azospirillum sp. RU38E]SNT01088.1 hypothetical protein SAMN05880591_11328 [Azospirillum sp. RU37A]